MTIERTQYCSNNKTIEVSIFEDRVKAGFPSPVDEHSFCELDLNSHLIDHPSSTFFVRVAGDSMIDVGIFEDDLLVVDKSLEATNGKIVIAVVDGEFTVKRLKISRPGEGYLIPENKNYSPIKLDKESCIWGVVTGVVRKL